MKAAAALALVVAACSSGKPRTATVDDAVHATSRGDATPTAIDATPSSARTGDAQIRVEWQAVPVAARASAGRTPCQTPRAPAVTPTTTWGIPDVLVLVDGAPTQLGEGRVTLADCAITPRVTIARTLVIESAMPQPARVAFARRGDAAKLDAPHDPSPRQLQLPIAGHAVQLELEAGGAYQVVADARDLASIDTAEAAWVIAAPGAVTDASGQVLVRDLSPGKHTVTAWLPPRAGQPARIARGEVTVVAGDQVDLVLQLEAR